MGKKYLDTKGGTLESSILGVWNQAAAVTETNKNNKSDDGEGLDAVQPKAVKKKFDDRKDKDIDNDGDTDDSDEYLHKRRKAISKKVDEDIGAISTAKSPEEKRRARERRARVGQHHTDTAKGQRAQKVGTHWKDIKNKERAKLGLPPLHDEYEVDEGGTYMSANRQLKDPKKEMMISLKGKVKVIDKSDWPMFKKKGYVQAEDKEMDEGGMKRGKDLDTFKPKPKKEEVDLTANADDYTQASYFKVQSMRDALRKVWNVEEDWTKKGPDAYDKKKKEAHVPGHDDEDDEKVKGKNAKTETGKKAAEIDTNPQVTVKHERKRPIKSGTYY
jgi:hypothetical protein